jgi:acetyl esterase/lipase
MLVAMIRPVLIATFALTLAGAAEPGPPIPLWKGEAPGNRGDMGPERDTTTENSDLIAGRRIMRIGNITAPALTVYRAPQNVNTGAAVLVFPGGGYRILAWDLEGTEICEWLNSIGVTGILVKYRVPAPQGVPRYAPALQDAQRAIGMVRARAKEWGIDPRRVGVLGFSAGAHLSAALSTNYSQRTYERVDEADDLDCRPDFAVLIYPGGIVPRDSEKISPEIQVTANTPPAIIVQSTDDNVRVENSLAYYAALKSAKVPVEMHLYPSGGHGYGLRRSDHLVTTWPARVDDWMRSRGLLGKR